MAEKVALQGQLEHLEGQLGSLQGRAQELLLQSQQAQEHSSRLQVGAAGARPLLTPLCPSVIILCPYPSLLVLRLLPPAFCPLLGPGIPPPQVPTPSSSQAEKSLLELQGQELHRKLGVLEEEVRAARQAHEEARGQQQALLRDHEALAQLQRRQEAELEGLLGRHRDLKANMRTLELAHRELQGR